MQARKMEKLFYCFAIVAIFLFIIATLMAYLGYNGSIYFEIIVLIFIIVLLAIIIMGFLLMDTIFKED